MKKTVLYIISMLILISSVLAYSVTLTTNAPVQSGQQLQVIATLDSQSGVSLWKVKNIVVPSGWTYVDKSVTGASGTSHNELCGVQDDGKFGCALLADTGAGSVVAKTITLKYTVNSQVSSPQVSGNWEVYANNALQNSNSFNLGGGGGTCDTSTCGTWSDATNSCGTRTCTDTDCIGTDVSKSCSGKTNYTWFIVGGIALVVLMFAMKKR